MFLNEKLPEYTRDDWRRDQTFKAAPGQRISEEIYYEMLNVLPPIYIPFVSYKEVFGVSEPLRHTDEGVAVYSFFLHAKHMGHDIYFHLGSFTIEQARKELHDANRPNLSKFFTEDLQSKS